EVVFAGGDVARLGRGPLPGPDGEPPDFPAGVARKVASILRHHADAIPKNWPRSPRNRAGYALAKAGGPDSIDLARLVVGSEGALALVAEAPLRTVPIPAAQAAAVLPFARLTDAASAVMECLAFDPSACDLFDWRSIQLARDASLPSRAWLPESAEAALLVE